MQTRDSACMRTKKGGLFENGYTLRICNQVTKGLEYDEDLLKAGSRQMTIFDVNDSLMQFVAFH